MYSRKDVSSITLTKALLISDVHIESGRTIQSVITPAPNYPIIVAGDLGRVENTKEYNKAIAWLCSNFKWVFLVPGNHEYYTPNTQMQMSDIDNIFNTLENMYPNLFVFRNEWAVIEGIVVYGGPLWSYVPSQNFKMQYLIKDNNLVSASQMNSMYFECVLRIQEAINYATRRGMKCMVVTHYAPSYNGTLHEKWDGNKYNCMYSSNLDDMVENNCIQMWIYGHTGFNGRRGKLTTNQCDKDGYRKDILAT